jgi:proline iminopeptidase
VRTLYPEIAINEQWMLARDEPHSLYVEECGNPDGIPVLFVHGGPGAGCDSLHRRFFDPNLYRIILFDQRGCGRSTPHACLANNTTGHLVDDIEAIRLHLGVSKWLLFGGSWGSTLSLAYAQRHPRHVVGMILRGIFLCRAHEIEWFYQQGASRIQPDYWADFVAPVAEADRSDMVRAYHELLGSENEITRMKAARAWCQWEARCSHLQSNQSYIDHFDATHAAMAMAQIENHYFCHGSFLAESPLLQNMEPIQDIPGIIIHGRYDIICPLENAVQLHEAWPISTLNIIPAAGHAATEPGITDALVKATSLFANDLLNGIR